MLRRSRPFLALSLMLAAPATADVLVVDDDLGPGVDFQHPVSAIAAASDGDVVLVKAGTYAPLFGTPPTVPEIDGKSLSLVADAGASVVFAQMPVTIRNLSAGQSVTVRGIRMAQSLMSVESCDGPVWIEDVVFEPPIFTNVNGDPAVDAVGVASLALLRCELVGSPGSLGVLRNGAGLRAFDSTVSAYDCAFVGGNAHDPVDGDTGEDGARLNGGSLFASGCSFEGGDGHLGFPGGAGLRLATGFPTARLLDSDFQGGAPGGLPIQVDTGTTVPLAPFARSFVVPSTVREGELASLAFAGEPNDLVIFSYSAAPGHTFSSTLNGPFLLDLPPNATLVSGTIGPDGTLEVPLSVNELGPGIEGIVVHGQPVFFRGATFALGGASATVLLDAAL